MTREQAIEIARRCAKSKPQSYYAEPFQPHEWVIDAIMLGAQRCEEALRPCVDYLDEIAITEDFEGPQTLLGKILADSRGVLRVPADALTPKADWRGYCECKWDGTRSKVIERHPACRFHSVEAEADHAKIAQLEADKKHLYDWGRGLETENKKLREQLATELVYGPDRSTDSGKVES